MAAHHVLVSGATGFLGAHLVATLKGIADTEVTALLRPGHNPASRLTSGDCKHISADIRDGDAVRTVFRETQPTHVINAATYGVNPAQNSFAEYVAVNVTGTYNLLSASAEAAVKRFTQIGSYFEYGRQEGPVYETVSLRLESTYAATKAAAGLMLRDQRLCGKMETVIARAFHLWGPGEAAHRLTPQVIRACREHRKLDLTEGRQVKDFTYVRDASRWVCALTLHSKRLPYIEFNIAGGQRSSVREFATQIAHEMNGVEFLRFGNKAMPGREPPSGIAETDRLKEVLGDLHPTDISAAITETIAELST
jgi:nucleoside-diphosphate-sugar epimerase